MLHISLLPFFLQPLPSYVVAGLLLVPFRSLLYCGGVYGVFGLNVLVRCLVTGPSCKGVMPALGDACWIVRGSVDVPGVPGSRFSGPPGSTFGRVSESSCDGSLTTPSLCLAGPAPSWFGGGVGYPDEVCLPTRRCPHCPGDTLNRTLSDPLLGVFPPARRYLLPGHFVQARCPLGLQWAPGAGSPVLVLLPPPLVRCWRERAVGDVVSIPPPRRPLHYL